ncbi:hypothetical protein [Sporomusa sp. KB1]|jgi:hypothetical protein|uniref:hypothetical protein n=1 Tax=Sporomusa sp. KB1 TaxID=943346 RepID=UPI00119D08D1|nr:hypothetical protein [Sporomusa sp. KB1]TWH47866.1 hypothetical protein Salpa_3976 [Sporomusa sp. KB1]
MKKEQDKRDTKKGGAANMAASLSNFPIIKGETAQKLRNEYINPTPTQRKNHEDAYMRALKLRRANAPKPIK